MTSHYHKRREKDIGRWLGMNLLPILGTAGSILHIDLSKDLKHVRICIDIRDESLRTSLLESLYAESPLLQKSMSKSLEWRRVPRISFEIATFDEATQHVFKT
jgi:ribosome-binding factor A